MQNAVPAGSPSVGEPGVAVLALDGTSLGERGAATRRRLLDELRSALAANGNWASVSEISRAAGVASATFYRYFRDIDEACLELAEELVVDTTRIAELATLDWMGEEGLERVTEFVEAFIGHWESHGPVLRMRNLAFENGDERFRQVRLRTLRVITSRISAKIRSAQEVGLVSKDVHPGTAATLVVGMLERVGGFAAGYGASRSGGSAAVRTVAVLVQVMVCGPGAATDGRRGVELPGPA